MSKTRTLIALVAVVTMIDGQRKTFEPGEQVTGLHKADEDALIACGSLEDRSASEKDAKAAEREQAKAEAEFQAAREAVQAQQATIAPVAAADTATANTSKAKA
jgi:hypothetical protein